jgi:hypothetical protein
MMQASALPFLAPFITFGYYPDNGSVSAADNRGLCQANLYAIPLLFRQVSHFTTLFVLGEVALYIYLLIALCSY